MEIVHAEWDADDQPWHRLVRASRGGRQDDMMRVGTCPGSFDGTENFLYLRHLDGGVCALVETGLDAEDARRCLVGGADIYVNPEGFCHPLQHQSYGDVQYWIRHSDARDLMQMAPVIGGRLRGGCFPGRIDLLKGLDGQVVLHIEGRVVWGDRICTYTAAHHELAERELMAWTLCTGAPDDAVH